LAAGFPRRTIPCWSNHSVGDCTLGTDFCAISLPLALLNRRFEFSGKRPCCRRASWCHLVLPPFRGAIGSRRIFGAQGARPRSATTWASCAGTPVNWLFADILLPGWCSAERSAVSILCSERPAPAFSFVDPRWIMGGLRTLGAPRGGYFRSVTLPI